LIYCSNLRDTLLVKTFLIFYFLSLSALGSRVS
jgi:hypothetical protein